MPDAVDWFQYRPGSERHILGDLSELAVRLGSPVAFDRRGDVLWFDDFEYGVNNWSEILGSAQDSVTVVETYPHIGKYAVRLQTGGIEINHAGIGAYWQAPQANKWGVETAVWLRDEYTFFYLTFIRYNKTYYDTCVVRLVGDTREIQIKDSNAVWQTVATIYAPIWTQANYHHLKIVGDFENGVYQRLIWDIQEIDLTSYDLYRKTAATSLNNYLSLGFTGEWGGVDYCQVAYVILTANEP